MQGKGETIKDGRRFIHGTLADRAVRRWLEQDEPQLPGQMAAYVDDLFEEHAVRSPEYKIRWKGDPIEDQRYVIDLAKRVVNNVEPFLLARVIPFEYEPELRFRVPIRIPDSKGFARTIVLNGGMDIAVKEPSGLVSIYDLKATTNEQYVHGGIMPQLIFYSIAWSFMFGAPEHMRAAFLTPACKTQYHELNITSQDRRHLMSRIVQFAHATWQNTEPICTDDNSECYYCDVKGFCPKFAVPKSKDSKGKHRASLSGAANLRKTVKDAEQ